LLSTLALWSDGPDGTPLTADDVQLHAATGLTSTLAFSYLATAAGGYYLNVAGTAIGSLGGLHNGNISASSPPETITITPPLLNGTATEGSSASIPLGSFTDTAASSTGWNVVVNWGDGSSPTTFTVMTTGSLGSQAHTYADDGNLPLSVTVTNNDTHATQTATPPFQVVAFDAALNGIPLSITSGSQFNGNVASFTDANPLATVADFMNATIDWGDSATSAGTVTEVSKYVLRRRHAHLSHVRAV
jgi:hypothetical protein